MSIDHNLTPEEPSAKKLEEITDSILPLFRVVSSSSEGSRRLFRNSHLVGTLVMVQVTPLFQS